MLELVCRADSHLFSETLREINKKGKKQKIRSQRINFFFRSHIISRPLNDKTPVAYAFPFSAFRPSETP